MEHYRLHLRQKANELDLILSQIKAGAISRDQLVERILRSIARNAKVNDVDDYPLYKVCAWLSKYTHDQLNGKFSTRVDLAKAIAKDTDVPIQAVVNMLAHEPLKIPEHFKKPHRQYTRRHLEQPDLPFNPQPSTRSEITLPANLEVLTLKSGEFEIIIKLTKKEVVI